MAAVRRFAGFVIDKSLLLVAGTLAALVWANVAPDSYGHAAHVLHFAVNDVAMVFFFARRERIVEATREGGPSHLRERRRSALARPPG